VNLIPPHPSCRLCLAFCWVHLCGCATELGSNGVPTCMHFDGTRLTFTFAWNAGSSAPCEYLLMISPQLNQKNCIIFVFSCQDWHEHMSSWFDTTYLNLSPFLWRLSTFLVSPLTVTWSAESVFLLTVPSSSLKSSPRMLGNTLVALATAWVRPQLPRPTWQCNVSNLVKKVICGETKNPINISCNNWLLNLDVHWCWVYGGWKHCWNFVWCLCGINRSVTRDEKY
jgi:hypothetical protein